MATEAARLQAIRKGLSPSEWRRTGGMAGSIALLHILGWGILVFFVMPAHFHLGTRAFGFGVGVLAYTLGMRHAFDADHISAIDNTTRKLMAEGKRPLSVGFFFSLGHSSVVFVVAMLLAAGVRVLKNQVGRSSSTLHAVTNLVGIGEVFVEMRRGRFDHDQLEAQLNARGFMYRFFGGLARRIDTPWKMYPIGFLF